MLKKYMLTCPKTIEMTITKNPPTETYTNFFTGETYVVVKDDCILVNKLVSSEDPYKDLYKFMAEEIHYEDNIY